MSVAREAVGWWSRWIRVAERRASTPGSRAAARRARLTAPAEGLEEATPA